MDSGVFSYLKYCIVPIEQSRFQKYNPLEFIARQVVEGFITGLHKSPFHGFSVEFAEHRLYNDGESTRHIDWKLYARTDKLFVKRFEEETNLRCRFVLDNSSSMYFPVKENISLENPNKITFSTYAVACLMYLLRKQRDAVGLSVFSDTLEMRTQARSSDAHHKYLYHELEKYLLPHNPAERNITNAAQSLHLIAENTHKRSLVVIFSDMFDSAAGNEELFSALQHLKHNKHEVILFHVVDKKKEVDFEFDNRPYRFVDMETKEELKINPRLVKEEYARGVSSFTKELALRCASYHIDFVEADINSGFDQILLPYLIKRQKMN
jgi:uncharacterized protein (DUF58 family)